MMGSEKINWEWIEVCFTLQCFPWFDDLLIFFQAVVITRDNVCFSLTTWLICVYISFTDKKTMKFKGYQTQFLWEIAHSLSNGSQITSTYLKCLSDRLWIFSPDENATPARVCCSRDRQARKKNEKVVKKMPS